MATEQSEYDKTFNQIKDEDPTDPDAKSDMSASMQIYESDIATQLNTEWEEAERAKIFDEDRHLRALRQYRGQYDPEILSKIHPNRSKANIRLTRTKVKTYDARMMDIKFPANEDNDWNIEPTPVPELNPQVIEQIAVQMFEQTGQTHFACLALFTIVSSMAA